MALELLTKEIGVCQSSILLLMHNVNNMPSMPRLKLIQKTTSKYKVASVVYCQDKPDPEPQYTPFHHHQLDYRII